MNTLIIYIEYSAIIEFDSKCNSLRREILDNNHTITFYANMSIN